MKKETLFPTDLTTDEVNAGFILLETRIPLHDREITPGKFSSTVVAVLRLEQNVRLLKMRNLMPLPGDNAVGYMLQLFAVDACLPDKPWHKPQWETAWGSLSNSLDAALARYHRDGIPSEWLLCEAPVERTVSPSELE